MKITTVVNFKVIMSHHRVSCFKLLFDTEVNPLKYWFYYYDKYGNHFRQPVMYLNIF